MKKNTVLFFILTAMLALTTGSVMLAKPERPVVLDIPRGNASRILDVPYINQRERYPTGCESVSAVMALNYLGLEIGVDEFIDLYLDMEAPPLEISPGEYVSGDPRKAFIGSPYSEEGFGCYAPAIVKALGKFIDGEEFEVKGLYDESLESLCGEYIDRGIPVILWATLDMQSVRESRSWTDEESGIVIDWIAPMHCLLLVGYDKYYYYFNDPWQKKECAYLKGGVETAYKAMLSQAVVIIKNN